MQTMLDCYFKVILLILSEVILPMNSCFHVYSCSHDIHWYYVSSYYIFLQLFIIKFIIKSLWMVYIQDKISYNFIYIVQKTLEKAKYTHTQNIY